MPVIMLARVVMDNDHNSLPLFGVFVRTGWMGFVLCSLSVRWNYLYLSSLFFMFDLVFVAALRIITSKGSIYGVDK